MLLYIIGASSYSTSTQRKSTSSNGSNSQFFPQTTYRTFDMGDPTVVITKLKEFNQHVSDANAKASGGELENLIQLCDDATFNSQHIPTILKILNWPEGIFKPELFTKHDFIVEQMIFRLLIPCN